MSVMYNVQGSSISSFNLDLFFWKASISLNTSSGGFTSSSSASCCFSEDCVSGVEVACLCLLGEEGAAL